MQSSTPTLARRYIFKLLANIATVPVYLVMEAILPRALGRPLGLIPGLDVILAQGEAKRLRGLGLTAQGLVSARGTLTNTGERKGTEVAQLYIGDIVTSYSWTDRELKAFQRVELEPGETKTVAFDIPVSECTIVDSDANRIVEPGEFEVLIGHSSRRRDLKRTTFTVA